MPKAIKTPNAPVRKRPKAAASSAAIKEHKRKSAKAAAQDWNSEVKEALNTIDKLIDSITSKYSKSFKYVQEAAHLIGHVLKSHYRPGINNAWAHCEAHCETNCKFCTSTIWYDHSFSLVGLDDPSKNKVQAFVSAARKLPGLYHDLLQEQ